MVVENIQKTEVILLEKEELFQVQETEEIQNTEEVLQKVIQPRNSAPRGNSNSRGS